MFTIPLLLGSNHLWIWISIYFITHAAKVGHGSSLGLLKLDPDLDPFILSGSKYGTELIRSKTLRP